MPSLLPELPRIQDWKNRFDQWIESTFSQPDPEPLPAADAPQPYPGLPAVKPQAVPQRSFGTSYRFDPNVEDAIERVSRERGIDPGFMRAIASIESSGNPRAVTGSYNGLYQLSRREGRGDLFDPYNNATYAAQGFGNLRRAFIQRFGREPEPYELYMMHQQGPAGTPAHIGNPTGVAWQNVRRFYNSDEMAKKAVWGNVPGDVRSRYNVDTMTSQDFLDVWKEKVRRRYPDGKMGPIFTAPSGVPIKPQPPTLTPDYGNDELVTAWGNPKGFVDQYFARRKRKNAAGS